MKRYLLVIITLFCALTVSAVRYASPYTGSGRNYGIYTSYSAYKAAEAGSLAQAPVASMSSTSRGLGSCGASTPIDTRTITAVPVSGIYTAAAAIRGGVTAGEMYGRAYAPQHVGARRTAPSPPSPSTPGYCEHCHYVWVEIDDPDDPLYPGYWVCSECGRELQDGCNCTDECHCVPLTDGWQVWLFMGALVLAYVFYKKRASVI